MKTPESSGCVGALAFILTICFLPCVLLAAYSEGKASPGSFAVKTVPSHTTPDEAVAGQQGRIRREVNLVNVLASVMDRENRPAPDLSKESFQVFEEGVPQKIEVFESETH